MTCVCEKCANELTGTIIKCDGFCYGQFCLSCSKIPSELQPSIKNHQHLVWMCEACRKLLKSSRFKKSLTSVRDANESIIEALKTDIRDSILTEVRNEVRNEIRTSFKEMIDTVPMTPFNPVPSLPSLSSRKKRPRDIENDDDHHRRPAKLICGTSVSTNATVPTVNTAELRQEQFWLYLSGIHPSVSDEDMKALVNEALGTPELSVVKLVPKDKDIRSLTFISFKIGMPTELKEKAMSATTWPIGIKFREFENGGSRQPVFWKPSGRNNQTATQPM
nr:uncharacterized protein LOC115262785 [Aedes albopictus]XP_029723034.1 uncharacterized protein LOC115263792 [Aedes albopictus]XP_029731698.1 uncharacterized protein LOC115267982 [Aedes albopictus]